MAQILHGENSLFEELKQTIHSREFKSFIWGCSTQWRTLLLCSDAFQYRMGNYGEKQLPYKRLVSCKNRDKNTLLFWSTSMFVCVKSDTESLRKFFCLIFVSCDPRQACLTYRCTAGSFGIWRTRLT